jgi:hypothetical protein
MPSCDHCLLEIAPGDAVVEDVGGKEAVFCCSGCRNIHALLCSEGLEGFYARRREQVTTLGILLDPVADKLLISAAFISLVQMRLVPAWMAAMLPRLSARLTRGG